MPPRRSTRSTRPSEQRRSKRNPNQKVSVRRARNKSKRADSKKRGAREREVRTSGDGPGDILDVIDAEEARRDSEEARRDSEEDRHSLSSVASGPSGPRDAAGKSPGSPAATCAACRKLHRRATRMRAARRDGPPDDDPESLTCDEWVLIKIRRPSRVPNLDGKLLEHIHLMKNRLVSRGATLEEKIPPACCRPHLFLQRNLKRAMRVMRDKKEIKRKLRKRSRNHSQVPCVVKERRRLSNRNEPHDGDHLSSPEAAGSSGLEPFEYESETQVDDTEDTHITIELVSSGVTMDKPTRSKKVQPKPKAAKKTPKFRDLLAQMHGNSSVIIKE